MSLPLPAPDESALQVRFDDTTLVVVIPDDLGFEALRDWLREHVPAKLDVLAGRPCRLDFGDREIKLFDLRRLVHLLRDEWRIEVTGLYVRPQEIHRYAERELKLKLFAVERGAAVSLDEVEDAATEVVDERALDAPSPTMLPLPAAENPSVPPASTPAPAPERVVEPETPRIESPASSGQGRRSLSVQRTLRSGASIRFDGDVVLFGDVNPGAQIVATGNIVVLGALKGLAHAGATGDEEAFILGFDLRPTQIRIGRRIAMPPERSAEPHDVVPEIARVIDGQIVIEPYRGKVR